MKTQFVFIFIVAFSVTTYAEEMIPVYTTNSPTLHFNLDTPDELECRFDKEPFKACISPLTLLHQIDGKYNLVVRRKTDKQVVMKKSFIIDGTTPKVVIDRQQHPRVIGSTDSVYEFEFHVSKKIASSTCFIDDQPYEPCVPGKTLEFKHLTPRKKPYVFRVEVVDSVGNKDTAQSTWEIISGKDQKKADTEGNGVQ